MGAGQRSVAWPNRMVLPNLGAAGTFGGGRELYGLICGYARHAPQITIKRLNTIYGRLVFFRNLCAHDERCYCAHANERLNESVFQLVNDLSYLLDQESYIVFRHQFYELLWRMAIALPDQYCQMFKAIGVTDQNAIDNIVGRFPMQ